MKQLSSDKDKNTIVDKYLDQAREARPFVSTSIARDALSSNKEEKVQEGPYYTMQLNSFGFFHKLSWASTALGLILAISLFFSNQEPETITSEKDWQLVKASDPKGSLKQILIDTVGKPDAGKIKLTFQQSKQWLMDSELIPPIRVSEEILKKLGFEQINERVVFEANVLNHGYLRFDISKNHRRVRVSDYHVPGGVQLRKFYPLYISDMNGKQSLKFRFDQEDSAKMSPEYFSSILDDLVPITVPDPINTWEDLAIFWFKGDSGLFELLLSDSETASTNVVPQPLPAEDLSPELKILNNPFKHNLSISYRLKQAAKIKLDLVSIGAAISEQLITPSQQEAGEYNHKFGMSHLQKGIYLLVLTVGNERITKRIIKQ